MPVEEGYIKQGKTVVRRRAVSGDREAQRLLATGAAQRAVASKIVAQQHTDGAELRQAAVQQALISRPREYPELGNSGLRQEQGALGLMSYAQQRLMTPEARSALMSVGVDRTPNLLQRLRLGMGAKNLYDPRTNTILYTAGSNDPNQNVHEPLHAWAQYRYGANAPPGFGSSVPPGQMAALKSYYAGGNPLQSLFAQLQGPAEPYAVLGSIPGGIGPATAPYYTGFWQDPYDVAKNWVNPGTYRIGVR